MCLTLHLWSTGLKSPSERRQLELHLSDARQIDPALSGWREEPRSIPERRREGPGRETGTGEVCSPQGQPQDPTSGQPA